jgi:hypothetical protein
MSKRTDVRAVMIARSAVQSVDAGNVRGERKRTKSELGTRGTKYSDGRSVHRRAKVLRRRIVGYECFCAADDRSRSKYSNLTGGVRCASLGKLRDDYFTCFGISTPADDNDVELVDKLHRKLGIEWPPFGPPYTSWCKRHEWPSRIHELFAQ